MVASSLRGFVSFRSTLSRRNRRAADARAAPEARLARARPRGPGPSTAGGRFPGADTPPRLRKRLPPGSWRRGSRTRPSDASRAGRARRCGPPARRGSAVGSAARPRSRGRGRRGTRRRSPAGRCRPWSTWRRHTAPSASRAPDGGGGSRGGGLSRPRSPRLHPWASAGAPSAALISASYTHAIARTPPVRAAATGTERRRSFTTRPASPAPP